MTVLISVGTVLFLILSALLVILILLQSDKSAGMGILGGSSQSTFGSSTADIITKITGVMVGIFMLGSLGLAVLESYRVSSIEREFISSDSDISGIDKDKLDADKKQNTGINDTGTPIEAGKENK
ncbi:MAG: preprotein translocase subunit SecG [Spirochaetes bacterium]|nr:preprotein translocase subunit SecG [Spirochaetota bacterium]